WVPEEKNAESEWNRIRPDDSFAHQGRSARGNFAQPCHTDVPLDAASSPEQPLRESIEHAFRQAGRDGRCGVRGNAVLRRAFEEAVPRIRIEFRRRSRYLSGTHGAGNTE